MCLGIKTQCYGIDGGLKTAFIYLRE